MRDLIEFYDGKRVVGYVYSSMVPPIGSVVCIHKTEWMVERVTFALDHSADPSMKQMRCNVDVKKVRR